MICEQASSVLRSSVLSQESWTQCDRENQWKRDGSVGRYGTTRFLPFASRFLTSVSDDEDDSGDGAGAGGAADRGW